MRRTILIACLAFLPLLAGCTIPQLVETFSQGYTGGGYTSADRASHAKRQVEPSQHYQPWNQ